jgi:hypothetical protein
MKKLLPLSSLLKLGLLLTVVLPLEAVTVTNVQVMNIDHQSARFAATVTPTGSWMIVNYGTTSGYGYSSTNCQTGAVIGTNTSCGIGVGALAPGTTYHYSICGRPNSSNTTGQVCTMDATFATLADPGHPNYPTAPKRLQPHVKLSELLGRGLHAGAHDVRWFAACGCR